MSEIDRALTAVGGPFEIGQENIRGASVRVYKRGPRSLADVLEDSRKYGDDTYLIYGNERYTFREHYETAASLAQLLAERYQISKGDRVAIAMRNYPEFSFFFWATQMLGAIAVTLNAWWTESELSYALDDSAPVFLAADAERLDRMEGLISSSDTIRGVVSVRTDAVREGVERYEALRSSFPPDPSPPDVDLSPDDDSTILYTSGTTGKPKGAVLTHRNHCTNLMNHRLAEAVARNGSDAEPDADRGGTPVAAPMFHVGGLLTLYTGLSGGQRLALMYRWDPEQALDLVEQENLTRISGVVATTQSVLRSPSLHARDLSRLRTVSAGAAMVPPELVQSIKETFDGRVAAATGYGMTEATGPVTAISGEDYFAHPESVGKPTPVNDLRIVDERGDELPTGEPGELCIKGPNVMRGYWNQPEETERAFIDGWYRSGDVARLDSEGRVYIVDRVKEVVIRGGENVYCGEVEAALYALAGVEAAAVIGLPNEDLGEEVAAIVRFAPGFEPAAAAPLQDALGQDLARFKVPSTVVVAGEDLPRNAAGKVVKAELRTALIGAAPGDAVVVGDGIELRVLR